MPQKLYVHVYVHECQSVTNDSALPLVSNQCTFLPMNSPTTTIVGGVDMCILWASERIRTMIWDFFLQERKQNIIFAVCVIRLKFI